MRRNLEKHLIKKTLTETLALVCVLGGAVLAMGAPRAAGQTRTDLVFTRDVLPIIQESFLPLLTEDTGLDGESWESLMRGSEQGEVVIPFDADRSLLVERAEQEGVDPAAIARVRSWIESGAPSDDGKIAYADAGPFLYVCNQGSGVISIIDMEAHVVARTVDLRDFGFSENAKPHHVAVTPDGAFWYVSLIGEHTVLKFNRDNELVGRTAFEAPGMLAFDPVLEQLYVGRSMTAVNPPQRIGVIEPDGMDIEEIDVFHPRPHALNVTPDGKYVFSASLGMNQIAVVDAESMDIELVPVPGAHHSLVQFAVAPDGHSMIVGGHMSGDILFLDITEPMQPSVTYTLPLGGGPWHPSFLPGGDRVVFPAKMANAVAILDLATGTEIERISGHGLAEPHGSAVRPDGRYIYVSSNNLNAAFTPRYHREDNDSPNGSVAVIDANTFDIVKVIEVEQYPTGIGAQRDETTAR
ncbi:MAG: YncE family protein [Bacteroidetes bacterium SB0662_bin_6]|nr:YncE family protein [Bacteroidetes bacterium SB0668_bin_1]MYE04677.1 YncE family protein [Bacteroidetes bacterium SB0662_bin_6]